MKTRSFKLFTLALLAGGFVLINQLLSASAHDGHKKGHAPATANSKASVKTIRIKARS
jgi:hypothetical protein